MNDFTKDELQYILHNLEMNCVNGCNVLLVNKVKTLIDNYCEHEWRLSGIDAIYCPKCQKHVDYEI